MLEKLGVYLAVIAAAVMTVISILQRVTLFEMATRLIGVIILFYILGLVVRFYLRKKVFLEQQNIHENRANNEGESLAENEEDML